MEGNGWEQLQSGTLYFVFHPCSQSQNLYYTVYLFSAAVASVFTIAVNSGAALSASMVVEPRILRITPCAFCEMLAFNSAENEIQELEESSSENVLYAEEKHQ